MRDYAAVGVPLLVEVKYKYCVVSDKGLEIRG